MKPASYLKWPVIRVFAASVWFALICPSHGGVTTFSFEGRISNISASLVDPIFQLGVLFSGTYSVETSTLGVPATYETSFNFHYYNCVTSWSVEVQGLAGTWGGSRGQISIGDNAPFAGVSDRYAVTLFPEPGDPVVFANGIPFRFLQIDMADYRSYPSYPEPVGDMLNSDALGEALPDPALSSDPRVVFQDTAGNKAAGTITSIAVPEVGTGLLTATALAFLASRRRRPA
jgi:hypothetical protein